MDKSLKIVFAVVGIAIIFAAGYMVAEFEELFPRTETETEEDIYEQKNDDEEKLDEEKSSSDGYYESGDVDYVTKQKLNLDTELASYKSNMMEKYVYDSYDGTTTPMGDWNSLKESISLYKIGTVNNGKYEGGELLILEAQCMDMCISPYAYKFVKQDGNLIHLSFYDSSSFAPEYLKVLFEEQDKGNILAGVVPPKTIAVPGSDTVVTKSSEIIIFDNKSNRENRIGELVFTDPNYGSLYSPVKIENIPIEGCLYFLSPDGIFYKYEIDPGFFGAGDYVNITKSTGEVIDITSNYSYSASGCGVQGNCYRIDGHDPRDLTYIGQSSNGYEFYLPNNLYEGASDNRNEDSLIQLADTMHKSYNQYVEPISFKEFLDQNPILIWKDELDRFGSLVKSEFQPPAECGKPVIYLYPTKTTDVSVEVEIDEFTVTVPDYNDGWLVSADPNGQLYNYADKTYYDSLFWEGKSEKGIDIGDNGFVVKRSALNRFLGKSLKELGLNRSEIKDFKDFWIPEMMSNNEKYFEITFIGTNDFNKVAPLNVDPKPDSVIRVFMNYEPVDYKRYLEPQKLNSIERDGFTLVEWGGTSSTFHGIK
jgi:hypothetical protein